MRLIHPNLLITGATGFIGSRLCERASAEGWPVRRALRQENQKLSGVVVGELGEETDWSGALKEIDVVVHLAARVHVMKDTADNPLSEFRRTNVKGTLNLARQSVKAGVKRFVFISSIKVNGEYTPTNQPFTTEDTPDPIDAYGISKYEAEEGLRKLAIESGLEVVVIRPPLVYGPGVKGNFLSMMRWLRKEIPLPFGAIHNKRSLVALDNLIDLICACIVNPAAANQVFLAGDGVDLSTAELLDALSAALGKSARLYSVPHKILELGLISIGKKQMAQKLCGSLQVDISKGKDMLGWYPVLSVEEGLRMTAKWYLRKEGMLSGE